MTGPNGNVPYNAGYSGASPINGININPVTGEITFTPTILGNFVVAVLIEEFDSNGNLVGSIIQDFQFEIIHVPILVLRHQVEELLIFQEQQY